MRYESQIRCPGCLSSGGDYSLIEKAPIFSLDRGEKIPNSICEVRCCEEHQTIARQVWDSLAWIADNLLKWRKEAASIDDLVRRENRNSAEGNRADNGIAGQNINTLLKSLIKVRKTIIESVNELYQLPIDLVEPPLSIGKYAEAIPQNPNGWQTSQEILFHQVGLFRYRFSLNPHRILGVAKNLSG